MYGEWKICKRTVNDQEFVIARMSGLRANAEDHALELWGPLAYVMPVG